MDRKTEKVLAKQIFGRMHRPKERSVLVVYPFGLRSSNKDLGIGVVLIPKNPKKGTEVTQGFFVPTRRAGKHPEVGEIFLALPSISVELIAHEATHAIIHILRTYKVVPPPDMGSTDFLPIDLLEELHAVGVGALTHEIITGLKESIGLEVLR